MRIKKRTTGVLPPDSVMRSSPMPALCHFTIYRHPLYDPKDRNYSDGPANMGQLAVYNGVAPMDICPTPDALFETLHRADHWFLTNHPARYSVVAWVFGMSFTFIVMPDGTYERGWGKNSALKMAMPNAQ